MQSSRLLEVFLAFLRQGLTAFGGPVAHLGYFRADFVERRKWLTEATYANLVAMCQFLPGPASSQVGMAIGLLRAGYAGLLAAWIGFTLPSAIAMTLFAYGVSQWGDIAGSGSLHGLKVAAVAVVALAVLGMARSLAPDRMRASVAVAGAVLVTALPGAWGQVSAIMMGGLFGLIFLHREVRNDIEDMPAFGSRSVAIGALALFFALLIGLPFLAAATHNQAVQLVAAFFRAGSLVFGGGHVVLPLLQADVVGTGLMTNDTFLAGYGAAQAVPGPLFTFAAYLGAMVGANGNGWLGAALCTVAIFLPSMLLIVGTVPFWDALRRKPIAQAVLAGVNAAVVGLLLAALYYPVWTSGIMNERDFVLAAVAFLLLFLWRFPPWLVVILCAIGGAVLA
ncbi:chromate efflux transporter [Mesorhizobium sp. INR15]|uniref:chromate efflux transporter n=1 Tax=Mesorhizobium sp. INR15 TaxID=2654248 RepID=UPI00189661C6|nr:chromate efflux transporter [Mesorhizobium sp. INR15]QPC95827.1 chromate efflux transporter [Mesorhizobium sp. INR15]